MTTAFEIDRRTSLQASVAAVASTMIAAPAGAQTTPATAQRSKIRLKRGYQETPLGDIHYAEAGSGKPVILMHHNVRSYRAFRELQPALAQRYRTIALDTMGFGLSDPLPPSFTIEMLADNVIPFLDALKVNKACFYGLSTGNKITSALCARHPDRVERVILTGVGESLLTDTTERRASIQKSRGPVFFADPPKSADGSHLVRKWMADFDVISRLWFNPAILSGAQVSAEQIGEAQRSIVDYINAKDSVTPMYLANWSYDFGAALRAIKAPALIIEAIMPELGPQAPGIVKMMQNARSMSIKSYNEALNPDLAVPVISEFFG